MLLVFKVWIRESGFANLPAWICKDLFPAIVLRICQDSWGFVGFVKTGWIFGSSGHKSNPRFDSLRIRLVNPDSPIYEVRFLNHATKRTFLESGFVTSMFLRITYTIPASLRFTCWMLQSLDHNSNNNNGYIVTLNQLSGTQHFVFIAYLIVKLVYKYLIN